MISGDSLRQKMSCGNVCLPQLIYMVLKKYRRGQQQGYTRCKMNSYKNENTININCITRKRKSRQQKTLPLTFDGRSGDIGFSEPLAISVFLISQQHYLQTKEQISLFIISQLLNSVNIDIGST